MNDTIPESPDSMPVYFGKLIFKLIRKSVSSLSDYLKIPDDRILGLTVGKELFKAVVNGILNYFVGTLDNVLNEKLRISTRHI